MKLTKEIANEYVQDNKTFLWIYNKNITSIEPDAFNDLPCLEKIHIESDSIASLPCGIFDNLTELKVICINCTILTSLPQGLFKNLFNLVHLNLWDNSLTSLPQGLFDDLTNLEYLDLSCNRLKMIDSETLKPLKNLEELHLENNLLTSLQSGTLDNLKELRTLSLECNLIESISDNMFKNFIHPSTHINLSQNPIHSIGSKIFGDRISYVENKINFKILTFIHPSNVHHFGLWYPEVDSKLYRSKVKSMKKNNTSHVRSISLFLSSLKKYHVHDFY